MKRTEEHVQQMLPCTMYISITWRKFSGWEKNCMEISANRIRIYHLIFCVPITVTGGNHSPVCTNSYRINYACAATNFVLFGRRFITIIGAIMMMMMNIYFCGCMRSTQIHELSTRMCGVDILIELPCICSIVIGDNFFFLSVLYARVSIINK